MPARRLLVNSGADVAGALAGFVAELAAQGGLAPAQAYRLRLAADEIVTNIAGHGYRGEPGVVDLDGYAADGRVWLRVEDDAPKFDPRGHHPDPRLAAEPPLRAAGGLGLHLALTVVDEFGYEHVHGRNRNVLVLRRERRGVMRDGGSDERYDRASRC
ncbi:ATP-binding protein [Amycolatopsis sp. OK19-0408]|uniref:ATP-binding protein n=1 Tax=Amycolatopsis iheyensis TaxID=2945988 RepID=A0A9X2SMA4_9PSEU|nr:ATP-binding protein [Amycolatopsis iheyensis]MCR6487404.1 ATP-binding protein [Amycolatopsis iheyensis]